jgi:hypothetical protein
MQIAVQQPRHAVFRIGRSEMAFRRRMPYAFCVSKQEPAFRTPPIWIHASEAGKWLLSRREAKRRAVLAILDRVPDATPSSTPLSSQQAARRSRS